MDRVQALGTGLVALGGAILATEALGKLQQGGPPMPAHSGTPPSRLPAVAGADAARKLNASAAILATSVLLDSSVEHYRGSFRDRAMYTPLVVAASTLAASVFGTTDKRPAAHWLRDAVYAAAALTGLVGFGFHAFNILKRPGRLSWLNLFYSAPIGAPVALTLAGAIGRAAERVRDAGPDGSPRILDFPAGRVVAGLASVGIAGTVGEAGLLHFRGAFQNPVMYVPVTLPPVASALLAHQAFGGAMLPRPLARAWLKLTALIGFLGVAFHVYGVSRAMGGWRNWSQNMVDGPPIPAPPSFTGLSLAGLAALELIEEEKRE